MMLWGYGDEDMGGELELIFDPMLVLEESDIEVWV
jgi:hypothetical protein